MTFVSSVVVVTYYLFFFREERRTTTRTVLANFKMAVFVVVVVISCSCRVTLFEIKDMFRYPTLYCLYSVVFN